jgi:hypothetical protein
VCAENRRVQAQHLAAAKRQSRFFEASNDFAADLFFDGVRFQQDECAFHDRAGKRMADYSIVVSELPIFVRFCLSNVCADSFSCSAGADLV